MSDRWKPVEAAAEAIAYLAHRGQADTVTGEPYIGHVRRVVALVKAPPERVVAWLHDVLEDSDVTVIDLHQCGITYALLASVVLLTRAQSEGYLEYIRRIVDSGDQIARAVKLADLRDHLRPNCPERLRTRYERAWAMLTTEPLPDMRPEVSVPLGDEGIPL